MSANLLHHPVTHALGWALVHFLWQGAAVTALLAGVLSLMRRQTAQARYLAACAGLALMAASPAITLAVLWEQPAGSLVRGNVVLITEVPSQAGLAAGLPSDGLPRPAWGRAASALSTRTLDRLLPGMVAAWLAGVLFLSLRLLGGWMVAQRLAWRGTRPIGGELAVRAAELARCLGIRRPVLLLESAAVQVPTVIGWLRAVILFPAGALSGLPPRQIEAILAHELAHVRRYDYLVNLAQAVVETALFYHPCVWWVSRRIRDEREHCCDDLAVEALGDRVAYARALASLAELRGAPLAPALAASGGDLLARIRRVLGHSPEQADPVALWMGGAAAVLLLFGTIAVMRVSATDAGDRLANALVQRANVALLRITPARAGLPVTEDRAIARASLSAPRTDAGPYRARGKADGATRRDLVPRPVSFPHPRALSTPEISPRSPLARPRPAEVSPTPTASPSPAVEPAPAARPAPAASPTPSPSPSAGVVLVSDQIRDRVRTAKRELTRLGLGEDGPAGPEWAQLAQEVAEAVSERPPCPARRSKRPVKANAWPVITAGLEVGQMKMEARIVPAANLKGANLSGKHLSAVHLASADLADARLARTDLSHADLTGANLSDAHLANANLARANLSGANLRDADLSHADLSGANLSGADLTGARLEGARLNGTALQGARLRETHLEGVDLARADLRGADLADVDLTAVHLAGASLVGVNLADAHLAGADLTGANLTGANLGDADLSRTLLARANLYGANLTDANLSRALLEGANLYGATLNGADLSGVDLSRVDLSGANGVGS